MDEPRTVPPPAPAPARSGWRQLIGGYASLDQGDCQALAFAVLHRCTGGAETERPAARDAHPATRRPAAR